MASHIDKEKTKKHIEEIVSSIHSEADIDLLNAYRSMIRKEVSFFNRGYFAAYLLMQLEQGGASVPRGKQSRKNSRGQTDQEDSSRGENTRYPLPDEEAVRIFISIGRNRRVFPREILGLINSKTSVSKDDIGTIRILDNYSFVQVRESAANEVIEALNGKQFRGRTLTVNFARARGDSKDAELESSETAGQENREPEDSLEASQ
ncbi:DbpA RNA binding domain-containing protein [Breznakiella homolactica]|uniref:DbpA RNA binding domain-containing protein n=1 Tax=Breznakiella homolactica TaxID=2798577 RepID=A0A7T8BCM2_9SPIR|nr:DbpA RNA binding domain-containing protein [Breznakiella homolactica]QQO10413.1 DbpA RNA binding domain-containing protein [Breznakiella homolactica]